MTQPAIKVEDLWKEYIVGHAQEQHGTFYDLLSHTLKAPFKRLRSLGGEPKASEKFWALQDVNFEIQPGEVVGVIGRNGAGKSTLLKILSRITVPTKGRIEVRGKLASLLEVGTGFHPELSGRENIYLNGAILGMSRREVASKFDEIVAFAEVEKFVDTPVKRYSSGMYVRLAFAVAANLDSDILLIDEVLSVGDTVFQDKCIKKMDGLSATGRTVLFVSHNLSAVSRLCTRGLVLTRGNLNFAGSMDDSLVVYARQAQLSVGLEASSSQGTLVDRLVFQSIQINNSASAFGLMVDPGSGVEFRIAGNATSAIGGFRVNVSLFKNGQLILALFDVEKPCDLDAGSFESICRVPPLMLSPGEYVVEILAYSKATSAWMSIKNAGMFTVSSKWYANYEPTHEMGLINLSNTGERKHL